MTPERGPYPPVLAVLKILKPAFWFIWATPFTFGYLASAGSSPRHVVWFVLVALGIGMIDAACNAHNELVDRTEDEVNQPNRTLLVDSIPPGVLWTFVYVSYGIGALSLVPLGVIVGPDTVALILCGGTLAVLYNTGPHLKRRPGLAQLAIGGAALVLFLLGWTWHRPIEEMPPPGWLMFAFTLSMGFLKDLPDAEGDRLVRAAGIFTIRQTAVRKAAAAAVYLAPYALLAALVAAGALMPRMLVLLALVPVALWLLVVGDRARTLDERVLAYQLVFLYVHLFSLVALVTYVATVTALVAAVILFTGRGVVLALGLDPRLVEPGFRWSASMSALSGRARAAGA